MIDILFVEDEEKMAQIVSDVLRAKDFNVRYCKDGQQAWEAFFLAKPDIVVTDVMMPRMDGFTLASKIREVDSAIPLIFLTARTAEEDVLKGFDMGGNDYLRKPFSIDELIARINSLNRMRNKYNPNERIIIGKYELNPIKHMLRCGDECITLSFRESELLKRLYERRNTVIHRKEILFEFWHGNQFSGRSLDVFVSRLRKHLKDDPNINIINVRNVGYKMVIT
ncbi:response regulator transcription factor [Sphingobacterium alkalisoli]|uniref:Response regulator transcription factor n=1 Tax=Sphingobacterium alkalisoli TaxID=1874115 RepID=A0A4U0H3P0_9SPHI|nr:response regulator transcription factor [Sphingobacterium alkalisoli]TJY65764.1 response regulator transcription factor [Sphingobacterium alkalisoli]GGH18449.1 DNA-binding response regulator [Sphingobacterium alkalisoli]